MIAYRHFLIAFHGPVLAPATGQHTDKHTIETVGLDAALDKLTMARNRRRGGGEGRGARQHCFENNTPSLFIIHDELGCNISMHHQPAPEQSVPWPVVDREDEEP